MEQGTKAPSKVAAAVAASLPVAAVAAGMAVLFVAAAVAGGIGRMFEQVGGLAFLVLGLAVVGGIAAGALIFFQGLGARVPAVLPIGAAALPWVGGAGAMMLLAALAEDALASLGSADLAELEAASSHGLVESGMRASVAMRGVAEASGARVFGCILGGALLTATAVSLGVCSLGQRAPRRSMTGVAVGAGSGMVFLLAAVVAAAIGRLGPASFLFVLPALAALVAMGLGGAGAGADEPHGRSSALAAAAPIAAGLAFVAGAGAAAMVGQIEVVSALAGVDPDSRARILVAAASEIAPATLLERWGAALTLVPAAALAAWCVSRKRPTRAQMAGAFALSIAAVLVVLVDGQSIRSAGSVLESAVGAPWRDIEGFEPARFDGESTEVIADAVVALEAVLPRDGEAVAVASLGTPAGRAALTALFVELLRVPPSRFGGPIVTQPLDVEARVLERERSEEDAEEGGKGKRHKGEEGRMGERFGSKLDRYGIKGPADNPDPHMGRAAVLAEASRAGILGSLGPGAYLGPTGPTVSLAVDGRLPAESLRSVLVAAQAAGARSVRVIGWAPGPGVSAEEVEEVRATVPLLGALASRGQRSFLLLLERWLPEGTADRDLLLLHATVNDAGPLSLATRAGVRSMFGPSSVSPLVVGPRGSAPASPSPGDRHRLEELVVYLSIGPAATAGAFFDTADRVAMVGPRPLVVLGAITPGHPERPPEGVGDLAGVTGDTDALGALMGDQVGDSFGYGGLGLRGSGRVGGGTGEGTIGLGNLGAIGHGAGGGTGSGFGRGTGGLRGRSARVPTVRPGTAIVRGSLSKEVVRRVVRSHMNEIKFCYEQQLARLPDLQGRVSLDFVISPSGAVQTATVAGSTLGNATAEGCMARAVRRWAFPAPEGGGIVMVTYPFMFQAASDALDPE